jgi:dGTPase
MNRSTDSHLLAVAPPTWVTPLGEGHRLSPLRTPTPTTLANPSTPASTAAIPTSACNDRPEVSALAPWACQPHTSRGRRVTEPPAPPRTEHQRDRDRIVHCTAFRRLVYKTQVFINHEGDLFRTRLTHSLEVAQLARSVARALRLNEDLVEAIALAHDFGHTPFGHAGQDALHDCMQGHGGFEHNLQTLRVVDKLEQRYFAFPGLNLSFETREGLLKHCSRRDALALCTAEPHGPAHRFLHGGQPSLEAQVVNLADELAYGVHDIDDGVRSGLLRVQAMRELPLFARAHDQALAVRGAVPPESRTVLFETLRRMLTSMVEDLIATTAAAVQSCTPADADAVRAAPPLAAFSTRLREETLALKSYLFKNLYRHPQVVHNTTLGRVVVTDLFAAYLHAPHEMPADHAQLATQTSVQSSTHGAAYSATPTDLHRAVADYVAGMTDRFALREHVRLTGQHLFPG